MLDFRKPEGDVFGNLLTPDPILLIMRRLFLLRHAKAERSLPGAPDRDRALIERGRQDAAKIGTYMAGHGLVPDRVLVSSAARAQQTWRAAAAAFKPLPAADTADRLYNAAPQAILALIKDSGGAARTLLVVGHNPSLHELAVALIASGDIEAREQLREGLTTSGLVIIDFAIDDWARLHPRSGRLERFVTPKSLESAAG
ncbi:MAG TPA: histidine phosphatase family protein [Pseudolabrys sp.]|jgi:phosphohistidine phosphatase|nr:histidine phosphatase family protein [Pseudolabrys sp.]